MNTLRQLLSGKKGSGSLLSNSMWMLGGQGLSLVSQAIYFIVIARLLGTAEYGLFVGAAAAVSIVSQYSTLGSGLLFLRYVSPEPARFARYWGNILLSTMLVGAGLVLALGLAAPWLVHGTTTGVVVMIAVGDCICGQLTLAISQVFQAFEKMRYTAMLNLLTSWSRMLVAVVLLCTVHHANASLWVSASLGVSVLAMLAGAGLVTKHFGLPHFDLQLFVKSAREGSIFAVSGSTTSIYNDVDKAMLAHFGLGAANGIYTMAYRLVDIGTIPIRSVHAAAFPRFFRHGAAEGLTATARFARELLKKTALLGLGAAAAMFLSAPVIPFLVGKSFLASVPALRWLCLIPFLRSFHLSAGDALAGAGRQSWRLTLQIVAAALNIALNLYLIPRYTWWGAAWASLITDGSLGLMMWMMLLTLQAGERRAQVAAAPGPKLDDGATSLITA